MISRILASVVGEDNEASLQTRVLTKAEAAWWLRVNRRTPVAPMNRRLYPRLSGDLDPKPRRGLLHRTIDDDRYPLSPRIQTVKAILAKIQPEPAHAPLPPPKVYAPP
jgi:hypothetical protein